MYCVRLLRRAYNLPPSPPPHFSGFRHDVEGRLRNIDYYACACLILRSFLHLFDLVLLTICLKKWTYTPLDSRILTIIKTTFQMQFHCGHPYLVSITRVCDKYLDNLADDLTLTLTSRITVLTELIRLSMFNEIPEGWCMTSVRSGGRGRRYIYVYTAVCLILSDLVFI